MEVVLQSEEATIVHTNVILHTVESNGNKYVREQTVKSETFHRCPFPTITSEVHWVSLTPEGSTGEVVSTKAIKELEKEFLSLNPRYKQQ